MLVLQSRACIVCAAVYRRLRQSLVNITTKLEPLGFWICFPRGISCLSQRCFSKDLCFQWWFKLKMSPKKDTKTLSSRTFFKGMVKSRSVLDSLHVNEPNGTNQRQWGLPGIHQERPKSSKLAKRVIFKGDTLFQGVLRDSKCSGLLACQGTSLKQSDTINIS